VACFTARLRGIYAIEAEFSRKKKMFTRSLRGKSGQEHFGDGFSPLGDALRHWVGAVSSHPTG